MLDNHQDCLNREKVEHGELYANLPALATEELLETVSLHATLDHSRLSFHNYETRFARVFRAFRALGRRAELYRNPIRPYLHHRRFWIHPEGRVSLRAFLRLFGAMK